MNPGEIAASKTQIASFAIYDTVANEVNIIEVENAISLKTPLTTTYLKENATKLGFRSKAFRKK